MDYRALGRTGVQVSKLCLGTMMFGAWGNTDHDDSIRIIHRALDAGINFVDTADVYSAGESEEIVGKALRGRRGDGHRRDARRPDRAGPTRQGPLHRLLVVLGRTDRRGTLGGTRAAPGALPHRAAALLAAGSRHRARRAADRAAPRMGMSLAENQRKLEAVEQLAKVADDAGVSLIELAIAFVVNHPAVTSAIIGPRTMEQLDSQLTAADVELDAAVLDRIDEIAQPGVNLNPADTSYGEQVLEPALRRR
jgi:aryl-alcohol dehydrogenase-like predicted oxidoreductase